LDLVPDTVSAGYCSGLPQEKDRLDEINKKQPFEAIRLTTVYLRFDFFWANLFSIICPHNLNRILVNIIYITKENNVLYSLKC